ncbi:MAG: hypothetical protein EA421_00995, partial [Gemmatimonadales bacterium]
MSPPSTRIGTAFLLALLLPLVLPFGSEAVPSLVTTWTAAAQEVFPDSRERTISAVRTTGPIEIDGRLDEDEWARAEPTSGFIQREPFEGRPAMEETEVRI